jgi:predicted ribosomally synthesized peptide with nif11-like leader
MTDQLKEFLKRVNRDEFLAKKLGDLNGEQDREVVVQKTMEIAQEAGITLTEADFAEIESEMSDEEMEAVAGGFKKCYCATGGGGTGDEDGKTCACVAAGYGERRKDGSGRCVCAICGMGYK